MSVHSRYGILLVVFLATLTNGPVYGADFFSSLDQDNRTSACPNETVTYVCVVPDPSGGRGQTRWSGTLFQDQCPTPLPPDDIRLSHETFLTSNASIDTCGADLSAQILNVTGTGPDIEFTSALPVTATADLDGRTVQCEGPGAGVGQFVVIGSATLSVATCPAPTITITELTPESVSVSIDDYPEDTLLCNYTLMGRVMNESGQVVETFTTTNETSVIVDGLDLCTNIYTFEVSVMCGNVVSPTTTVEFNATLITLDSVTNVRSEDNFVTLEWDAPANAPDNCIISYQIEVEINGMIRNVTNNDGSTSHNLADFNLLPCEEYNVTVTPITARTGVVETSRSQPPYTIPARQDLPTPTIDVTEVSPQSVSVFVVGYPSESLQCIANFRVEVTSGTGEMEQFNESELSVDIELDLCAAVYTFQGQVMSNSLSSNMSLERVLNSTLPTLDPVTNVRSEDNFVTLEWDAPANAPADCIVNYQIAVDGFSTFNTTTDNSSTSISVSSLNLDICEEYFVTVAPITVRFGVVETSRSDPPYRLIVLDQVTNVRSDDESLTLLWDAPANAPPNCIMSYQIAVELDGRIQDVTTDDNTTSYNIADLDLRPREEYFVTVAPITFRNGLVETSRSDPPYRLIGPTTSRSETSAGPIVGGAIGGVFVAIIIAMLILNPILIVIYRPDIKSSKEPLCTTWVTIILVLVVVTIPFVVYLYCCRGQNTGGSGGGEDVDTELAVRSMTRDTGATKPEKKGKKKKKKEKQVQPAEEAEYSRLARPGVMSPQEAGDEYGKLNLAQVGELGGEEYSQLRHKGTRVPQGVPNPEDPMYSHL